MKLTLQLAWVCLFVLPSASGNLLTSWSTLSSTANNDKINEELHGTGGSITAATAEADHRMLQNTVSASVMNVISKPIPVATYFLPLREDNVYNDVWLKIGSRSLDELSPPMVCLFSVSISTTGTVVWVDHWEDGFDLDVTSATSRTTSVWGDKNSTNGCAPTVRSCTDANDFLTAGTSIVYENKINIPRDIKEIKYDGGDRIQSSFPIAVTRASYAENPGVVLAGAVEIMNTNDWGKVYEAPVGTDTNLADSDSFELSSMSCMAAEDNTTVTLPNATKRTLSMGQSIMVSVKMSERVTSDKPLQVILVTGDLASHWETRFFPMRPVENWATSYLTPVGDTYANTRVLVYNPSSTSISVTVTYLDNGTTKKTNTVTIASKKCEYTNVIPDKSGALIESASMFLALSVTDSKQSAGSGNTNGDRYDWGFPLVPTHRLTSQVMVGLGWACKSNDCDNDGHFSPVWVSPMEDADFYVDYDNSGVAEKLFAGAKQFSSTKITDVDYNMSGAIIYAVKPNQPKTGTPVRFAAAWGQDPSISDKYQSSSMDLGTTILPFPTVSVVKFVDKDEASPGESLKYTIRISNVGQVDIAVNTLTLKDVLDSDVTYTDGTTQISLAAGSTTMIAVADAKQPITNFPLDESGYKIPTLLPRRGGTVDITFNVQVKPGTTKTKVVNTGTLTQPDPLLPPLTFEATTLLIFPGITVANTVYIGSDMGLSCATKGVEKVTDVVGTDIVYCFLVTNTGSNHLKNVILTNPVLDNFWDNSVSTLAPGESRMVPFRSKLTRDLVNTVVARGTPSLANGNDIPGAQPINATDPSSVAIRDGCIGNRCRNADKLCMCANTTSSSSGAKNVTLQNIVSTGPTTCTLGETVKVTISADIMISAKVGQSTTTYYDLGWYVATDGGNAYNGTCQVDGLQRNISYNPTAKNVNIKTGNTISYTDDMCGDWAITNTFGVIRYNIVQEKMLPCVDDLGSGKLTLSVCFTWKDAKSAVACDIFANNIPDLSTNCQCGTFPVPTINVTKPVCTATSRRTAS